MGNNKSRRNPADIEMGNSGSKWKDNFDQQLLEERKYTFAEVYGPPVFMTGERPVANNNNCYGLSFPLCGIILGFSLLFLSLIVLAEYISFILRTV